MKKVSILIPHFRAWEWLPACIWHFRTYGLPIESEIIVTNNSPDHPSILALTETELGEGVKVIPGRPEFPSHGTGYDLASQHAKGDWFFTSETDSFPTQHGWFNDYVAASAHAQLIGPPIPQSSGRYIHPAGALVSRKVIEAAKRWQQAHGEWVFVPGGAVALEISDRPYHAVVLRDILNNSPLPIGLAQETAIWETAGPWQEMRSFDEDTFDNYSQRTAIMNWESTGRQAYRKIGYEAGQWLSYFAAKFFTIFEAPTEIEWMPGWEGRQASGSTVFGGFRHIWCGTVASLPNDIAADVRAEKLAQRAHWFGKLPGKLRKEILALKTKHGDV